MIKKIKTGLLLTTLTLAASSGVHAQTGGSAGGTGTGTGGTSGGAGMGSSTGGTGGGATGVTGTQGAVTPSGTGVGSPMGAGNQISTPGNAAAYSTEQQAAQNAQNARANSAQANPGQAAQQNSGGGVFGPSSGPGIFGPASTAVTTDIYGNQQPVTGTVTPQQQAVPVQGGRAMGGQQQQARSQNPISYDANGQPLPSSLYPQNQLPRDQNPILPSGSQQVQPGGGSNSGTVTGR